MACQTSIQVGKLGSYIDSSPAAKPRILRRQTDALTQDWSTRRPAVLTSMFRWRLKYIQADGGRNATKQHHDLPVAELKQKTPTRHTHLQDLLIGLPNGVFQWIVPFSSLVHFPPGLLHLLPELFQPPPRSGKFPLVLLHLALLLHLISL